MSVQKKKAKNGILKPKQVRFQQQQIIKDLRQQSASVFFKKSCLKQIDESDEDPEPSLKDIKEFPQNQQADQMTMSKDRKRHKTTYKKQSSRSEQKDVIFKKKTSDKLNVLQVLRITDLVRLFYDKLAWTSVLRQPVQFDPFQKTYFQQSQPYCNINFTLPLFMQNIISFLKVIYIIIYICIMPLSMLYNEVALSSMSIILQALALCLVLSDIFDILKSSPVGKYQRGLANQKVLQLIRERKYNLIVQIIVLFAMIISTIFLLAGSSLGSCFELFMILNIRSYFSQISKLEDLLFTATHYEKYWDLIKVFCMNLILCHLLGCILVAIARINPHNSWMNLKDLVYVKWYEQYIWSYYFATTIILTIGFGDLYPGTPIQALFVIFISFLACVFFGYNINYIGNLINSIRQQQIQKNVKLKVLNSLTKKADISKETYQQISNYITQQSKVKQQFNFTQEKQFIKQLPQGYRSSFLQQANQKLFNQFIRLIALTRNTVQKLSLKIQNRICHPDQIIKKIAQDPCIQILQSGQIGLIAKKRVSKLNNIVIQTITNKLQNQSKLICVDLLTNQPLSYEIKSLAYTVIHQITKQAFQQIVKESRQDYEIYRQILDKHKFRLEQYQLIPCQYCQNRKHTLFNCPRLHYRPFRNVIPLKHRPNKIPQQQCRMKYLRKKGYNRYQYVRNQPKSQEDSSKIVSQCSVSQSLKYINQNIILLTQGKSNKSIKQTPSINLIESDKSIKDGFHTQKSIKLTMDIVTQLRDQLNSIKNKTKQIQPEKFQFTLWSNDDCDIYCDYVYYFPKGNSSNLRDNQIKKNMKNISKLMRKKTLKKEDSGNVPQQRT